MEGVDETLRGSCGHKSQGGLVRQEHLKRHLSQVSRAYAHGQTGKVASDPCSER